MGLSCILECIEINNSTKYESWKTGCEWRHLLRDASLAPVRSICQLFSLGKEKLREELQALPNLTVYMSKKPFKAAGEHQLQMSSAGRGGQGGQGRALWGAQGREHTASASLQSQSCSGPRGQGQREVGNGLPAG